MVSFRLERSGVSRRPGEESWTVDEAGWSIPTDGDGTNDVQATCVEKWRSFALKLRFDVMLET